jgi:DNA polymerase-1
MLALQDRLSGRGYTETPLGRKRFFELPKKPYRPDEMSWEEYKQTPEYVKFKEVQGNIQREGKNHVIQGCSADMTKKALYYLYHELPAECYIVASVHDEIVLECPDSLVGECVAKMKICMMRACRDFLQKVAVPEIKVNVAQYWSK